MDRNFRSPLTRYLDRSPDLVFSLYAVAAADDTITTVEDNEIFEIATAIGVGRTDVIAIRSEWKQYLGTLKALPGER